MIDSINNPEELVKADPWCFLYAFDSDFREWFNRVIYLGIQRRDELVFPPHHLDPTCWTDDEGNRRVSGAEIPLSGVVYSDHTDHDRQHQ